MNKFTHLEKFKKSFSDVYTMSWVYAGIVAYFSQQNKFRDLEFTNNVDTLFVKDWHTDEVDNDPKSKKYFGFINEGSPKYWFDLCAWTNTTLITGHDNVSYWENNNKSIGFDRWDFHIHRVCTDPRISQEINRISIEEATYDVLILKGADKSHRNQWLLEFEKNNQGISILTSRKKNNLSNSNYIDNLGYEDYFNKLNLDQFYNYNMCSSFYDQEDTTALDFLPHRRMFGDSRVNVILETTCESTGFPFLTEKTWKSIVNFRPFILFGDVLSLEKLRKEGFHTFEEFCDESYDREVQQELRIEKSVKALHQLIESCKKNPKQIDEICLHNQRHYFDLHRLENKLSKFGYLCLKHLYN